MFENVIVRVPQGRVLAAGYHEGMAWSNRPSVDLIFTLRLAPDTLGNGNSARVAVDRIAGL